MFEVVFGPGRMGIKMKSRKQCLAEGDEEIDVVYLEDVPDEDITIVGPAKKVPLLHKEPVILAVNGSSVTGKPLKHVVQVLSDAARPLTLRLQIGTMPAKTSELSLRSSLTPVSESPFTEEVSSPEVAIENPPINPSTPSELHLDLECIPSSPDKQALSPRFSNTEEGSVRRYYRDRSKRNLLAEEQEEKQEEPEDEDVIRRSFNESMRIHFLIEMCELLEGYSKFIRKFLNQC